MPKHYQIYLSFFFISLGLVPMIAYAAPPSSPTNLSCHLAKSVITEMQEQLPISINDYTQLVRVTATETIEFCIITYTSIIDSELFVQERQGRLPKEQLLSVLKDPKTNYDSLLKGTGGSELRALIGIHQKDMKDFSHLNRYLTSFVFDGYEIPAQTVIAEPLIGHK